MFNSAFLKVERAYAHINNIESAFNLFRETHSAEFIIGKDPNTGTQFIDLDVGDAMPVDFPVIIGDAIHNLRTALDHAMWELMGIDKGIQDRNTAFPFSRTKTEYEAACNGVKTPRDDTKKFLISLEAYEDGAGECLYGLNRLDIRDKHIMLTPVINFAEVTKVKIILPNGQVSTTECCAFSIGPQGRSRIFANIPAGSLIECLQKPEPTMEIFFGDVEYFETCPLIDTLFDLYFFVKKAISSFDDFVANRN